MSNLFPVSSIDIASKFLLLQTSASELLPYAMDREQAFSLRAVTRFSGLLLGGILAISIYDWYGPGANPPSNSITPRYVEISGLEDRRDAFSNATLVRRDDYSCGPKKPCSNGACCGRSGYCGYGSTYCGSGCVSNCDATAECGKDAKVPGTQCPLNTCCSQYGFVSSQPAKTFGYYSTYLTSHSAVPRNSSAQVRSALPSRIFSELTTNRNRQMSE